MDHQHKRFSAPVNLHRHEVFFGQDCYTIKVAENAIERDRLQGEADKWRAAAADAIRGQQEIALSLAEVMERESAMVTALAQSEAKASLLTAQLERADYMNGAQRRRIDELTLQCNQAGDEIERLEERIEYLRAGNELPAINHYRKECAT